MIANPRKRDGGSGVLPLPKKSLRDAEIAGLGEAEGVFLFRHAVDSLSVYEYVMFLFKWMIGHPHKKISKDGYIIFLFILCVGLPMMNSINELCLHCE